MKSNIIISILRVKLYSSARERKYIVENNIKRYRNKLDISQDVLSKRIDFAFQAIAKIETDSTLDPYIETVRK